MKNHESLLWALSNTSRMHINQVLQILQFIHDNSVVALRYSKK